MFEFQATTYGVEPHNHYQKPHPPILDLSTHEKSFNYRTTSSLISIVMRPDLATSGNLRVKCVVSLLTLYHRSNEISVETIGLVLPKRKTSRHLPPTMYNDKTSTSGHHGVFKNDYHYLSGVTADKFARSTMNGAISRYKFEVYYHTIVVIGVLFIH